MRELIFSVDIGGSKIKGSVIDQDGKLTHDYVKIKTPGDATPENVLKVIHEIAEGLEFDKIAAGFPGYVRDGIVYTAPNLGSEHWNKINFQQMLSDSLGKPARIANDADMLGLGVVSGKGFEIMITLGTGFGTAFYLDGKLLPHLEIAHHPIKDDKTYDEYVGRKALEDVGAEKWNDRIKFVLDVFKTVFNYDRLYLGGGNAKKVDFDLDANIIKVTNIEGIDGGLKLWKQ